jgi:hypothetical protein
LRSPRVSATLKKRLGEAAQINERARQMAEKEKRRAVNQDQCGTNDAIPEITPEIAKLAGLPDPVGTTWSDIKRDEMGRILPGQKLARRPKNKLRVSPQKLVGMILEALVKLGGVRYLVKLGKANPRVFASLLIKILPNRLEVSGPEEHRERIAILCRGSNSGQDVLARIESEHKGGPQPELHQTQQKALGHLAQALAQLDPSQRDAVLQAATQAAQDDDSHEDNGGYVDDGDEDD